MLVSMALRQSYNYPRRSETLRDIGKFDQYQATLHNTTQCVYLTRLPLDKMVAILADDIFKCIFLNEYDIIPIQISLKFVPRRPIDN